MSLGPTLTHRRLLTNAYTDAYVPSKPRSEVRRALLILLLLLAAPLPAGASRRFGAAATAPAASGTTFTALNIRYMSPAGSDGANGLTPGTAWATPDHAMHCGDVIIAAAGTYSRDFLGWGAVSNCPSTAGGIDGAGGIYAAVLLCGGSSIGDCVMSSNTASSNSGFNVSADNWSVQGWRATAPQGVAFQAQACANGTDITHHVAFINNIAATAARGFTANECALNHNVPGNGVDYFAVVGNIAFAANNDPICLGAIDTAGPANLDTAPGIHHYFGGNFAIANLQAGGCPSDGEGVILDTLDAHGYVGTIVVANNIIYSSAWVGLQVFQQSYNSSAPIIKIFNNTLFNNMASTSPAGTSGEINIQLDGGFPWNIATYNNITKTNRTTHAGSGGSVYAFLSGCASAGPVLTTGGSGLENVFNGLSGQNTINFSCPAIGTNFTVDPLFNNTADLLANHIGSPNCSGFETTTACMGWNYATRTASALSVIGDLTPGAAQAAGKGYQPPGDCAVDAFYPAWLKGIVYLHWDGAGLTEKDGLVQKPCSL